MKKLVYILVAFSAFSIGVVVYYLRPIVSPVSLCEISQNAELYQFNEIRIKGYMYNVGKTEDDFSVYDFSNDCLTGANLDITEQLKEQLINDEKLKVFIGELRQKNNDVIKNREGKGVFVGEVEIIGEIKKRTETTGIASQPFVIKANKIKQISPIRFLSNEEILRFNNQK